MVRQLGGLCDRLKLVPPAARRGSSREVNPGAGREEDAVINSSRKLLSIAVVATALGVLQSRVSCSGSMVYAEGLVGVIFEKLFAINHCSLFWLGWTPPSGYLVGIVLGVGSAGVYYFRTPLSRIMHWFFSKGQL